MKMVNREYATSFTVGTKAGRPDFSLQSIYLTQDYANDETMYNFQLWAGSTSLGYRHDYRCIK